MKPKTGIMWTNESRSRGFEVFIVDMCTDEAHKDCVQEKECIFTGDEDGLKKCRAFKVTIEDAG